MPEGGVSVTAQVPHTHSMLQQCGSVVLCGPAVDTWTIPEGLITHSHVHRPQTSLHGMRCAIWTPKWVLLGLTGASHQYWRHKRPVSESPFQAIQAGLVSQHRGTILLYILAPIGFPSPLPPPRVVAPPVADQSPWVNTAHSICDAAHITP